MHEISLVCRVLKTKRPFVEAKVATPLGKVVVTPLHWHKARFHRRISQGHGSPPWEWIAGIGPVAVERARSSR